MDTPEILLRLGGALVCGGVLGYERERRGRAAGLRTMILVCMAAALAGILSEHFYNSAAGSAGSGAWRPDPARLGAGLFAGIGFLGAGTIIRRGSTVQGVTTAALLWYITALGLCFGSGMLALGTLGTAIAALMLLLLARVERFTETDSYATLQVTTLLDSTDIDALVAHVEAEAVSVNSIRLLHDAENATRVVDLQLKFRASEPIVMLPGRIVKGVATLPGVVSVRWS